MILARKSTNLGRIINCTAAAVLAVCLVDATCAHGQGLDALGGKTFGIRQSATSPGHYRAQNSSVTMHGHLQPAAVRPGDRVTLVLTAQPEANWHVYARADNDAKPGSKPTLITFETTSGLVPGVPTTDAPVIEKDASDIGFGIVRYHDGRATWRIPIDVPEQTPPGLYPITGVMGYQVCEMGENGFGSCELPLGVRFQVNLEVGNQLSTTVVPVAFTAAKYSDAATLARQQSGAGLPRATNETTDAGSTVASGTAVDGTSYDLSQVVVSQTTGSLWRFLALAFLGGVILNLMPCVLPVIGLKVMSFVEQAGKSRSHALVLNVWYAIGIVTVFWVLASLAVFFGLSWGGQFGSTTFNATLAAVIFAMGLSLVGVWEIPIPGFFGSGRALEAAAKEGPLAAFLKGVVTTVLATPCTGPFMAAAIAWAINQPPKTTYAVFTSLGLGMASPYLVVGLFPSLLRFLPRPGPWMDVFKHVTGFILLATVIYLLSVIHPAAIVPTVTLLLGVGIACWLVSRIPLTTTLGDRMQSWALAGAILLLASIVSFGWLLPDVMQPRYRAQVANTARNQAAQQTAELVDSLQQVTDPIQLKQKLAEWEESLKEAGDAPWQPFSLSKLGQLAVRDGRTVLVDFSADWCLTCKTLEQTVLRTEPVEQAISAAGVVTMYADYTYKPPEIDRTIAALNGGGVPVVAIFPGNAPYQPIVFKGFYTQSALLEALERATGRSVRASSGVTAADAMFR